MQRRQEKKGDVIPSSYRWRRCSKKLNMSTIDIYIYICISRTFALMQNQVTNLSLDWHKSRDHCNTTFLEVLPKGSTISSSIQYTLYIVPCSANQNFLSYSSEKGLLYTVVPADYCSVENFGLPNMALYRRYTVIYLVFWHCGNSLSYDILVRIRTGPSCDNELRISFRKEQKQVKLTKSLGVSYSSNMPLWCSSDCP